MKNRVVGAQKQSLDYLFMRAKEIDDIELLGEWGKYLCVRVYGFLEVGIKAVFVEYADQRAGGNVVRYVDASFRRLRNMDRDNLVSLTGAFSDEWKKALERFLEGNGRKEAIGSIVGQRNAISHGRASSISVAQVRGYYMKIIEVIEFIEEQCGN